MTDLLPCPFCGCDDIDIPQNDSYYEDYCRYMWEIHCNKCYANVKSGESLSKAIEAWNRRAE